jgi:hypothetical protein
LKNKWTGTMNQVDLTSISTDQGTCSKSGGTSATCSIGTLAPGGAATVTVVLTAQGSGTVTDTAVGAASEKDADTSNNTAVMTAST